MEPIPFPEITVTSWQAEMPQRNLPGVAAIRPWLEDDGSLTRRLRRLGGRDFRLEVLGEAWECAGPEDAAVLGSASGRVRVRRVRLSARGSHLVYACTRMPPETLARHPWLGRLGHKPLGEALADRSNVQRTPFEFARLPMDHALLRDAVRGIDVVATQLWGRRSRFLIGDCPILVYEVFLPGLAKFGYE